ncbi:hypothetical protein C8Q79DRAFT_166539 [Trametes meyenii]|nr:hypothetical protein C8Q79DRAFT_166539 [Trametes meyenii]
MPQLTIPSIFQIFSKKNFSSDASWRLNAATPSTTITEFIYTVVPPNDRTESYDVVKFTKPFYKNRPHAAVFRAQLIRDLTSHSVQDVVCKILPLPEDYDGIGMSSLEREARIYQEKLVGLQGQCVPRFIGFFRWTDGVKAFECLITTWEGHSLPMDDVPWMHDVAYRSRILDVVLAIHRAGVKHNDLEELPKNLVIKDSGEVFVVDFGESSEHQCELPQDYQFQFYTIYPDFGDLSCLELLEVANSLDVWYPGWYRFLGQHTICTDEVLKGRKSLIEFVRNDEGAGFPEDRLGDGADQAIEALQAWIDRRKTYDEDVPLSIAPE